MKTLSLFLLSLLFTSQNKWETDFETAKKRALDEHKCILLNFSGSDWCGPCIRLTKDIFELDAFQSMANLRLILLNADFPRQKKNQLPKDLQKQNNVLADKYNEAGIFPLTVLLTPDGKVIKKWEGYPAGSSDNFINEIKLAADASK